MSGITGAGSVRARDLRVAVGDVRVVEGCAANAWPATMVQQTDGWQVRYSPGVANRRANSVLPLFDHSAQNLADRIGDVETFYGQRQLPSRFMISPASQPENLDDELERQGYHIDAPTLVQWCATADVTGPDGDSAEVELLDGPTEDWMSVYMEDVQDQGEIALKSDLIMRIGAAHILAKINGPGGAVAVGLCVYEKGWAGIFCMHTLQSHRRRGLGRQVLVELRDWARKKGAERMYLQVESDNPSARQFYQTSGFVTQYGYHYRTKETEHAIE
ncbi:MAG: GNAT family N-acetyltransferase [Rhodospirillales bacterium]|nr:GNAT family N-acetyltransferase [Rhodospirillales bacterium]